MAEELTPLDLTQLRVDLEREGAPWRSVDTTTAMLEERERRILLGVPLPAEAERERQIQQAVEMISREMVAAADLDPPLKVDAGVGPNWLAAK